VSTAKRYRKKPVVIEAIRYTGDNVADVLAFAGDAANGSLLPTDTPYSITDPSVFIQTLEGRMCVSKGDYVIRGVKGEFYPCKPDIFEATYDAVEGEATS
jgi:hypothetical protein